MFKVIIVGDPGVGKTNILSKYIKNEFNYDSKSSIGAGYNNKQLTIEGHNINVEIWDTSGQEQFISLTSSYYKGDKGAFVVYDITQKKTLNHVDDWINDLRTVADKSLTIVMIGNKCDLKDQREVSTEQGEEKAKSQNMAFMETSAFSGENIDKAFGSLINEIYKKYYEEKTTNNNIDIIGKSEDINLEKIKPDNTDKKKCCKK